jgi:nucleosome assembly protein 1-like 1
MSYSNFNSETCTNDLKKNQSQIEDVENDFLFELKNLEKKYEKKKSMLFDKRKLILEKVAKPSVLVKENSIMCEKKLLSNFWLEVLLSTRFSDLIETEDKLVLEHLIDVRSSIDDNNDKFTLEFYFSENKWFTNKFLTKTYYFIKQENSSCYARGRLLKIIGCKIDWREGRNLTFGVEETTVKSKHGNQNAVSDVKTKITYEESFFRFFETRGNGYPNSILKLMREGRIPMITNSNDDDIDDNADFFEDLSLFYFVVNKFIPYANLYFTGKFTNFNNFNLTNSINSFYFRHSIR